MSHLFIFVFISITLGDSLKKDSATIYVKSVLLMFSSKSFIVSGLTYRFLIQFEFIFVYGVKEYPNFLFLTCSCSVFPMDQSCQASLSMGFLGKNTGVGCHSLLQGIFPTQASNSVLPHCRPIL